MKDRTHSASRIKTLRISLRPGASTITQLAAALMKPGRPRAEIISVAGFFTPVPVPIGVGPQRTK